MGPRTADSPAVSWRLLGLLFIGSGALGALTLPFGQSHPFERWYIGVIAALAIGFGALTTLLAPRLPAEPAAGRSHRLRLPREHGGRRLRRA